MPTYDQILPVVKTLGVVIAGLALFLYGLEHFSREVERSAGPRLRRILERLTRTRFHGLVTGILVTAVLQSSTSTTVMAIGLVDAGVLSFYNSLAVVIGSNIGTTVTTQLVAFKVTEWGAVILAFGFLLSLVSGKASVPGKLIFYFGFVFFGLSILADQLAPLANQPFVTSYLNTLEHPYAFVMAGLILTAIVQSSSVVTGLAVVMLQLNLISFPAGIGIVLGANAGTTITAYLASRGTSVEARRIAWAQILFNVLGVAGFLPLIWLFVELLQLVPANDVSRLALGHAVFNLVTAGVFIVFLRPFARVVRRWVKE